MALFILRLRPFRTAIAIASAVAASAMSGGSSAATPSACEPNARRAAADLVEQWQRHAGRADIDRLASLYVEDAVLTTGNPGEAFHGRAAISLHLRGLLARHPMGSISETMAMAGCDRASSTGRVLLRVAGRRKGTRMLLAGRFQLSLVARDGQWQIVRHALVLDSRPNRIDASTVR